MYSMLALASFTAALGMVQFGFNTNIQVSSVQQMINEKFDLHWYPQDRYHYTSEHILVLSLSFGVGCLVGCASTGAIAEKCGRKGGLQLSSTILIFGAIFTSLGHLFNSIALLIIGKWIMGISCGLNVVLVPLYLMEIAPVKVRGALGTISYLGFAIGSLLYQIMNNMLVESHEIWPLLLVTFIPAILEWLLLFKCPESPRYLLISKGNLYEATNALKQLRCSSNVEDDLEEMRIEQRAEQHVAQFNICQLLSNKSLRKPLLIGIMIQLSQQMSGINAIFQYASGIFRSAGLMQDFADSYGTIGLATIMVGTIVATILLIDQTGRRTLQLCALEGLAGTSILLNMFLLFGFQIYWFAYMSVICTVLYVILFAIGPGPIPGMFTGELFTQAPRSTAMSVTVLVCWLVNFTFGFAFQLMNIFYDVLDKWAFLPYSAAMAASWILAYYKMPETNGQTFEQIASLFRKNEQIVTL